MSIYSNSAYLAARLLVLERDNWTCWLCGGPGATEADHLLPLSRGGSLADPANMKAAHRSCNGSRGNRMIDANVDYDHRPLTAWD
jgi:5-methylcytosine-specific restriction endonuclease McrA